MIKKTNVIIGQGVIEYQEFNEIIIEEKFEETYHIHDSQLFQKGYELNHVYWAPPLLRFFVVWPFIFPTECKIVCVGHLFLKGICNIIRPHVYLQRGNSIR